MGRSAFIKFVEGSASESLSLEELEQELHQYVAETSKTGQQLSWNYAEAAFPYTIEKKPEGEDRWFYLKGKSDRYHTIIFGVGKDESNRHHIQVVLPEGSTHGDMSKANELCKYLAKRLKAELHLFNGRVMYFNPRK